MILVRAWIRQALGASGAAVAVPAAMLGVLALLTLSGGLGRIGEHRPGVLGSPVAGDLGADPVERVERRREPRSAARCARARSGSVRARPHPARHPVEGRRAALRARPADPGGTAVPAGLAAGRAVPVGLPGARPPAEAPAVPRPVRRIRSPSHHPSPGPSLVRRVTDTAASAAGRLPGPLGPAAAQTIETVGSAAGALVPSGAQVPVQAPSQVVARLPTLASGG